MDFFSQLAAVFGVLILLGATLWWLRRRGFAGVLAVRRTGSRRMECLERLPLGPQHALHLVRLGHTVLLLASSPGGCSLVQTCPRQEIDEAAR